jgi:predicted glycoside hydrolase/deacetylase ChbG (UPF0249 family)
MLINADDFGWTDGHNQAVERAYYCGRLRRASLLSNGNAFCDAVELAHNCDALMVGVHLTLNEGRPLIAPKYVPRLTKSDGSFYDNVSDLARIWLSGQLSTAEVMVEWRAQLERVSQSGITINHLDSHKHVHVFPPIREAIVKLAQEYQIGYVRLPLEHWGKDFLRRGAQGIILRLLALGVRRRLVSARLAFADRFIGISHSGEMVGNRLQHVVTKPYDGITEVMLHPAVVTQEILALQKRYDWAPQYHFEEELEALCSLQF